MTGIEKKMLIGAGAFFVLFIGSCWNLNNQIEKAGGFSGIAVEAGKAIKDISAEIDKHEPIRE